MKILITGGLGTIGSVLVNELRKKKYEVFFCDLSHFHDSQYIRCDISSIWQLQRIFNEHKFDYVYHLAAEFGRWNGEDYYDTLWRSNAIGTKNLIRMQEKYRFRMIFTSSSEVYGDYEGIMKEDVMDKVEIKQLNDYAMTKWINEMQILNSAASSQTETVRVRLFNTYGPGEKYSSYRSVICLFAYRALHNIPYTVYLNHHRSSIFITDVTIALSNIIEKFKPGEVYNIGSNEYHDIKTCSDIILDYLKKNDSLVTYKDFEKFTTKDKKIAIDKAIRDIDYHPKVTLKEGIPLTIEWMKKEYNIG
ncbi:MAG: NAD(P)-dependent oxidoreductase [bacterium]|nr:NAD(P)-dependent oxidoreductase [bacterium]